MDANTGETMQTEQKSLLTKSDFVKVFFRACGETATLNYERFEALALVHILAPILKKLYTTKEDRVAAMKRHLEFYNSNAWGNTPIYGAVIALEEKNAMGYDVVDSINRVKVGLMGPFAGIGDSLIGATFRPLLLGMGATIALQTESVWGAIFFVLAYNIVQFPWRWWSMMYGYRVGINMLKDIKESNILKKLTEGSAILGLMVLGVLICSWVNIRTGVVFVAGPREMALQEIFDGLVPSLLPLLATLGIAGLLKKRISALKVMGIIFLISFVVAGLNQILGVSLLVS